MSFIWERTTTNLIGATLTTDQTPKPIQTGMPYLDSIYHLIN